MIRAGQSWAELGSITDTIYIKAKNQYRRFVFVSILKIIKVF